MSEQWIRLTDPDISMAEIDAAGAALRSPRLSAGPRVEEFEDAFAGYLGRTYGVAVASGTLGLVLALRALGVKAGDEVIAAAYSWHQIAHAVALVGATPVFADIDYWSGNLAPEKAAAKITSRTRVIVAGNCNGHPAAWAAFRKLAERHGVKLIEDSTEAIGSRYQGALVGNFGDISIFDFSQGSSLTCGEGGMLVTDDPHLARELRYGRTRKLADRFAIGVGSRLPMQGAPSEVTAAIGLAQLARLDQILERRKRVERHYIEHIQSFEGIKPPYIGPDVDQVHWMLYMVQLGTRFSRGLRDHIVDDLATEAIEAAPYANPLHLQFFYNALGHKKGDLRITEKVADRALVLPFHAHLGGDEVRFIVETTKDSSINVGAGAAIY